MKNMVSEGEKLLLVAPYDVASGDTFKVGNIIAVAENAAASGEDVVGIVEGVHDLKKHSGDTFSQGAYVYWDDTNKEWTSTTTSNTKGGVATIDAASGDATVRVRLNEAF